jgi:hypothetical protein
MSGFRNVTAGALALVMAGSAQAGNEQKYPQIIDPNPVSTARADLSGQPKIVQCLAEATDSVDIPGAHKSQELQGEKIIGLPGEPVNSSRRFYSTRFAFINTGSPMSSVVVERNDGSRGELKGYSIHNIGVVSSLATSQDTNYINISVEHAGSYDATIDAHRAVVLLEVDSNSKLVFRDGSYAQQQDRFSDKVKPTADQLLAGHWTIAAAQTVEFRFANCMGISEGDLKKAGRPVGAAQNVGRPPITLGVNESQIKFDELPAFTR